MHAGELHAEEDVEGEVGSGLCWFCFDGVALAKRSCVWCLPELGRQKQISEFKARMVYRMSSRQVKALSSGRKVMSYTQCFVSCWP